MLVVGGIKPRVRTIVPSDYTGCDLDGRFSQGLSILTMNNHSWATSYDPSESATAYKIHSRISKSLEAIKTEMPIFELP